MAEDLLKKATTRPGLNWVHALVVGPGLYWVGHQINSGELPSKNVGMVLMLIAVLVILYHLHILVNTGNLKISGFTSVTKKENKKEDEKEGYQRKPVKTE